MLQNVLLGKPTGDQAEKIVNRLRELPPGDLLPHRDIEEVIGVDRHKDPARYRTLIGAAMKMSMRRFNEKPICVRSYGYARPTPWQQVQEARGYMRKGTRQYARGAAVAAMVDDKRLTDPEHRKVRDLVVVRVRQLYDLARSETRSIALLMASPETAPRVDNRQ